MRNLQTSGALLNALCEASSRPISPTELYAQRVSFIMGSVKIDSGITREQIQQVLAKQQGCDKTSQN